MSKIQEASSQTGASLTINQGVEKSAMSLKAYKLKLESLKKVESSKKLLEKMCERRATLQTCLENACTKMIEFKELSLEFIGQYTTAGDKISDDTQQKIESMNSLGVLFKELSNNIGFSFSDQFIKNLQSSLVDTDSVLKRQEKSLAASEKKYSSRVGAALKKSKSAPITQDEERFVDETKDLLMTETYSSTKYLDNFIKNQMQLWREKIDQLIELNQRSFDTLLGRVAELPSAIPPKVYDLVVEEGENPAAQSAHPIIQEPIVRESLYETGSLELFAGHAEAAKESVDQNALKRNSDSATMKSKGSTKSANSGSRQSVSSKKTIKSDKIIENPEKTSQKEENPGKKSKKKETPKKTKKVVGSKPENHAKEISDSRTENPKPTQEVAGISEGTEDKPEKTSSLKKAPKSNKTKEVSKKSESSKSKAKTGGNLPNKSEQLLARMNSSLNTSLSHCEDTDEEITETVNKGSQKIEFTTLKTNTAFDHKEMVPDSPGSKSDSGGGFLNFEKGDEIHVNLKSLTNGWVFGMSLDALQSGWLPFDFIDKEES